MRISDWSSDVCSSDLPGEVRHRSREAVVSDVLDGAASVSWPLSRTDGTAHSLCGVDQADWRILARRWLSAELSRRHGHVAGVAAIDVEDRKSTRLNSSH